ncbi:MAG: EamA family transporter RarD [Myxococcota bacterium]|nr:EamA family transporter RarD [Myxococcales bacterium]
MEASARTNESSGFAFGVAAYGLWGLAPAYWKLLADVSPVELLAHRILWSLVVAAVLLVATRSLGAWRRVMASPRHALPVALAAALLASNWLVFIHAVATGQVLATSLGYYLNPLLSVVLGLAVLGERLRRVQWIAVAIAAAGVAGYVVAVGELPWISVFLAGTFGLYGLVRKLAPVEPIVGFGVEMAVMAAPAAALVAWLAHGGEARLPFAAWGAPSPARDAVVAASGLVTAAPLLCFNAAARRLPLVMVGILQYIAPSMTLALAVGVYGEPFGGAQAVTFGCVWVALAIFTVDSIAASRARGRALAATRVR